LRADWQKAEKVYYGGPRHGINIALGHVGRGRGIWVDGGWWFVERSGILSTSISQSWLSFV